MLSLPSRCPSLAIHSRPANGIRSHRPKRAGRRAAGFLAALLLGAATIRAADEPVTALSRDSSLDFPTLFQESLRRAPEFLASAARTEEARQHGEAARRWLAGPPSLEASYLDDRAQSAIGLTELEYGVQFPLWRAGERRDAIRMSRNLSTQSEAWQAHLGLLVSGRLREVLLDLDSAERLLAIERQATADAREAVATIERLFEAGEAANIDVAQARALLLGQLREEARAQGAVASAESAYVTLTGLNRRPATPHREMPDPSPQVSDQHPWLRLLAADVDRAETAVRRSRHEARGNPSVLLGGRRQRDSQPDAYHDSLLFSFSLPFGGGSHVASRVGTAQRERAEAEVSLQSARIELTRQLQQARRELDTVQQSIVLSEEQAALDRRQWEMARTAFEVGEVTWFQVLTALRQSRASAREHEVLLLQRERLTVQINQILGVLP